MTKWPLSTINCLAAHEMGHILFAIFRNGATGFGGYMVRLMLIARNGRRDLPIERRFAFKPIGFSNAADYIQLSGGYVVLTDPD